jgi:hypothetical protein
LASPRSRAARTSAIVSVAVRTLSMSDAKYWPDVMMITAPMSVIGHSSSSALVRPQSSATPPMIGWSSSAGRMNRLTIENPMARMRGGLISEIVAESTGSVDEIARARAARIVTTR